MFDEGLAKSPTGYYPFRQRSLPEILKNFTFKVWFEIEFFVLSLHENISLPESYRGRLRRCLGILRDSS